MNESALVTRETGASTPASTSVATTASETPPLCRVSSTTRTATAREAACTRAATGSGATHARSRTVQPKPSARSVAATRRLMKTPLPNVTRSRSLPVP